MSSIYQVSNHITFIQSFTTVLYPSKSNVQWGSEIGSIENRRHSKPSNFEDWLSNSPVFKGSAYNYGPNHLKTGHFSPDFKLFLTRWMPFVTITNGLAFRFQIPFKIQTICKPTSFWPFEIQTCVDFRSLQYTGNLNDPQATTWYSDPRCVH